MQLTIQICLVGVHNTEYEVQVQSSSLHFQDNSNQDTSVLPSISNESLSISNSASNPLHRGKSFVIPKRSALLGSIQSSSLTKRLQVRCVVGPEAYYVGVVDYLQTWTFQKQLERFYKVHVRGADANGLSAIEPIAYRDRFIRHMEDILDFTNDSRFSKDHVESYSPFGGNERRSSHNVGIPGHIEV